MTLAMVFAAQAPGAARSDAQTSTTPAVRITSPLGRTGRPGSVRIVAQVRPAKGQDVTAVHFHVDGKPQGTVTDGPPYAVDWTDENPFERRTILAEAETAEGVVGRAEVVLEPYELAEETEVTSVLVEAAIYDKDGKPVRGLTSADLRLLEDGAPQKPDFVAQEAIPTTFAVLVDSSQSMWRNIEFVQEAAGRLAAYLRPRDRVVVAPFAATLRPVTGPTNDAKTIAESVGAIHAEGGTAVRDAVIEMADRLSDTAGRRVVVLITDGYDEHSKATIDEALAAVKTRGITVYCVGIGGVAGISLKGRDELRAISGATGGRAFFPTRPGELPLVYDTLASDAQLRYLVTYTPTNQRRDGTWRTITLRTVAEGFTVKARPGYQAPKPPPVRPALEFTAMDLNSRFLEVTKDDLIVLEDGVEQSIDTFQEATAPVTLVLALDQSGSMKKSANQVVEAAASFVGALRPEDWLGVITFADKSMVAHGFTQDRQSTLQTLATYKTEGGTALYDALCDSVLMLKRYTGRKAIVVMTDGRDEDNPGTGPGSTRTWEQVVGLLREIDVTTFAVGLGPRIDPDRLKMLGTVSGGQAYFPSEVSELAEQYERIVDNLRHRYVIGYTSTNPARDGKWRSVEIRARSGDIVVHSRQGYFAPDR